MDEETNNSSKYSRFIVAGAGALLASFVWAMNPRVPSDYVISAHSYNDSSSFYESQTLYGFDANGDRELDSITVRSYVSNGGIFTTPAPINIISFTRESPSFERLEEKLLSEGTANKR